MVVFLLALPTASAQPSDIDLDERIVLFPTIGHRVDGGRSWSIEVHGWIFEDTWTDASLLVLEKALDIDDQITDPAQRRLLRRRLGAFVVDNERRKKAVIVVGDRKYAAQPSETNGHFRSRFELRTEQVAAVQAAGGGGPGRLTYRIETRLADKRVFTGRVHLLEPRGVSVISDIDDTIRVTQINDRRAMVVNTFLLPFKPVPGMAEVYAGWAKSHAAEFHYVSASPYQLYEPLAEFMQTNGFPEGTFHLKSVRLKDRTVMDLFDSPEDFKPGRIEPILKLFPEREFVCVGDSGEKDPEVYGALARKYPQIRRILIRDVTGEGADSPRYVQAFRGLPGGSWKVFKDPAEIRGLRIWPTTRTAPSDAPKVGQVITVEGRWNGLAKEAGQIVCDREPKIINVLIGERHPPLPNHRDRIRATAILRERHNTEAQKKWAFERGFQLPSEGFYFYWAEAEWELIGLDGSK